MAETLYRKYRPQNFTEIQGQEGIKKTLENQILSGRIAHAYIFAGTRGTGKTTTARVFAKAINCHTRSADSFEPCGTCPSCLDITGGHSVDVIELDAATHTGVDTVREQIIENARFLPTRDKFKIFIIDEVHMLSTSSFNALLKSLEEPPAHVVYILATTELHKVPATVASRCQRFIFRPLGLETMTRKLESIAEREGVTVDPAVIHRILAVSGGAMRDAESLLGQLCATGSTHITDLDADTLLPPTLFKETLSFITTLASHNTDGAFAAVSNLFETGVDLPQFHDMVTKRAHELLVVGTTGQVPVYLGVFSDSEQQQLLTASKQVPGPWLAQFIEALLEKKGLYRTISSPLIPLHLVIMAVEHPTSAAPRPTAPAAPSPRPVTPPPAPAAPAMPAPPPAVPAAAEPPPSSTTLGPMPEPTIPPEASAAPVHEPAPSGSHPVTRELIDQHWSHIIQEVVSEIPSLGIILHTTHIHDVRESELVIAVQFPLHRDKLSEIKVKHGIETRLAARCGVPIRFTVTYIPPNEDQAPEVADLLETFGGRVVG